MAILSVTPASVENVHSFFLNVSKKDFLRKMFLTRKEKCVLTNYLLVVSLTLYPVLVASFGLLTGTDAVTKRKQKSVNY